MSSSSSRKSSSNAAPSPADYAKAVDDIRRSNNFKVFFTHAFRKFDKFDSDKDWARQATLAFHRKFAPSTSFVTVYYAFLNEAEKQTEGYESESVGDDNSVDSNESYERDDFVTDKIEYEDGHDAKSEDEWESCESESIASESEEEEEEEEAPRRSTRTQEAENGQRVLHKIIIKEYNAWYQAFQDEAKEDDDEEAMTADERFQWHCAKFLSRKTDIRAKDIYPVIGAWLHEHHKA